MVASFDITPKSKNGWIWKLVIGLIIFAGIYTIVLVCFTISDGNQDDVKQKHKDYETAYFEGQRDAMSGDIRVRKVDNRMYVWIKSPYNDTTKPVNDTILTLGVYDK